MTGWIETLRVTFSYPFVRYALIVGLLIALTASLLGVTLVLRRYSFIGDGLSHVAFGAMAVAAVLNLADSMLLTLPVTVAVAVLLLQGGEKTKLKGDASIAVLSVSALALGYLLMHAFSTGPNVAGDVCSTLFGSTSILTLTKEKVWLCCVLCILVVVFFVAFYNRIFSVTFDAEFAKACGMKVGFYNLMVAVITAVIIVLAMHLVGSLLASALIVFPALASMRLMGSFKAVTVFAACFSVVCALIGLLLSIVLGTPVGCTIVAADLVGFIACAAVGKVRGA